MVAALGHDIDHPGVNNAFLRKTHNPLALRYNDRSVLENHHTAVLFSLLRGESSDLLPGEWEEYSRFRALVVDLILSTDMEQHFRMVAELSALADSAAPVRFAATAEALRPPAPSCLACDSTTCCEAAVSPGCGQGSLQGHICDLPRAPRGRVLGGSLGRFLRAALQWPPAPPAGAAGGGGAPPLAPEPPPAPHALHAPPLSGLV